MNVLTAYIPTRPDTDPPSSASDWLAALLARLATPAPSVSAQATELVERARAYGATQPSYAADLLASAAAVDPDLVAEAA